MRGLVALILIVGVGFLLYSNSLHTGFHFDDEYFIKRLASSLTLHPLGMVWKVGKLRFIPLFTFVLNYHLSGSQPFSYHLVNVIIHILTSLLVYWFVLLTLRTPAMQGNPVGHHAHAIALFSSLIFLCHPLQTQAVTYISQRFTSLSTLFYLAALILYIKARVGHRPFYYLLLILAMGAAFLSKENTVTLPFVIIVYEAVFFGISKRDVKKIILLTSAIAAVSVALLVYNPKLDSPLTKGKPILARIDYATRPPAHDFPTSISRKDYSLTQINVLRSYLRLLYLPISQNIDYDYPVSRSAADPATVGSAILLAALLVFAAFVFKRQRIISFCIAWFFITVSVESSIIPLPDVIAEHRLYLPLVGFSLFTVLGFYLLIQNKRWRTTVLTSCVLVLSLLTYNRNRVWQDNVTLWRDTVKKSPNKLRPYNNLGCAYGDIGKHDEAIAVFQKVISLSPPNAVMYSNLATAYMSKGDYGTAIAYYQKALGISHRKLSIYGKLAEAYFNKGDYDNAVTYYQEHGKYFPEDTGWHDRLALIYGKRGDYDKMIKHSLKSMQADPYHANAYYVLGIAYIQKGEYAKALDQVEKLEELKRHDMADKLKQSLSTPAGHSVDGENR